MGTFERPMSYEYIRLIVEMSKRHQRLTKKKSRDGITHLCSMKEFINATIQIPAFFLINASPSRASCMESGKMSRQIFVAAAMFGRAEPKASIVR